MASPAENAGEGSLTVVSERFGTLEVPADRVFRFEGGLIGFPSAKRFVLLDHRSGSPFKWMLSLDDPELAFAVANPGELIESYDPPLKRAAKNLSASADDIALFALVTIPADPTQMTMNLMAPIAVDLKSMTAEQLILDRPDLSPAHRIVPASQKEALDEPASAETV